jgi:hypothetical protein
MPGDLPSVRREFAAGIPGQHEGPGASARGCWAAKRMNHATGAVEETMGEVVCQGR